MKKIGKTILILLLIVFLFLLGLFIVRAKRSNELKSGLLREDSNGIIQQVVWGGNDLSINVNGPQTVLRIPIPSVVPETLTRESFKFKLNLYDENGNKLDYIIDGIERGEGGGVTSGIVIPFFKDSILGMKEFKMPVGAISRINEDTFQVELEDFDGYADMAGDDIRYKIFGKGKIDSVYLEIFHGNNVKLEFAIINEILDEPVVGEDYIPVEEWTKALKGNPSYTDAFKLDLNPIAIYSGYRWKLEIYSGVDDNYVYEMTYSTPDNPIREGDDSIPPITVSFLSDYLVTKDVINEKQDQGVLEINGLDFLHMLDNHIGIGGPYTSGVIDLNCWRGDSRKCNPSEGNYQCVEFPTGSGTVVLTGNEYVGEKVYYNYINHLSKPISWHPWSYTYANNTYAEAGEYCYIEIGKPSDLEPLPFKFGKGFENVIVTWTKDIKGGTECHDNLDWIAHDYALKIITDKIVCDLGINNEAKILEISIPDNWIE